MEKKLDTVHITEERNTGCWKKFTSLFEGRGFDLPDEIGGYYNPKSVRKKDSNSIQKLEVGNKSNSYEPSNLVDDNLDSVSVDTEFFNRLNEEHIDEEVRRKSFAKNRKSLRPSMYMINYMEKISEAAEVGETVDSVDAAEVSVEINENRSPPPSNIPSTLLYAPPEPLDLLCVFPERTSRVCSAACAAATRAGGDARAVRTAKEAADALRREGLDARQPHVVVVDARQPQIIDASALARTIRGTIKNTQHIHLIAVVKKSAYLKDEFFVLPYLEAGFNRVMVETVGATAWCAEMLQARAAALAARAQIAAVAALAAAADRCRDLVAVTDDQQRILLTNKSWCRVLGWQVGDSPRPLAEAVGGEALLRLAASGARDWTHPITLRRRAAPDSILLPCRGASIAITKSVSHVVLVCEPTNVPDTERSRGSMHSIRRASFDVRSVASDGLRRTSLVKTLPLEAPITRVINLLIAAEEGAAPSSVQAIEQVIDLLRATPTGDLYNPMMKDDPKRVEEPVAHELITALISTTTNQNLSSRRSSNDSTVIRTSQLNRPHKPKSNHGVDPVNILLETALKWDFEIFRLETLTQSRPLVMLGMKIMRLFDVCATLECDEQTMLTWLTRVEQNYHADNTYHNSTHAADVLQAVAYFLQKDRLKMLLDPLEAAASLIAAAAHDIDHPGRSSMFLCNSKHSLATLYNDISVLESHHAAFTFNLTLKDDRVNIFKNLDRESYKTLRHNIIDMILATEMTKHFEHLAKFVNVFYAKTSGSKEDGMQCEEPLALDMNALTMPENVILVKRMMIKCADVSNASRPQKFAVEWAKRIAEEYFLQTDQEKQNDLPVVMPIFDRSTCNIPRSQIGFIDYIIIGMMETWAAFIDMPELVTHARNNHARWRELDEAGITTIAEVLNAQRLSQLDE